ncbi:MAG: lipopolysaccharide biosynthesis protein [Pseudomonadota bacterium]
MVKQGAQTVAEPALPPTAAPLAAARSGAGGARRHIAALALAGGVEYALQAVVPIILVRCLDVDAVAQYRFLWLLTATALALALAFMPQALFYFLPRATPDSEGALIGNTLLYLALAGAVAGLLTVPWHPFLPAMAGELFRQSHGMSSLFIGAWIVASLLDVLPTAEARGGWQAGAMLALALLRTGLIVLAALTMAELAPLVGAILLVGVAKLVLLGRYLLSRQRRLAWRAPLLIEQWRYAFPFACGNALYLLRAQADQWVVASLMSPLSYAPFAIAGVFLPLATLVRVPINNVMMSRLNGAHARGEHADMARLIAKTNGVSAMLLLPLSGALIACAPELVHIIYTARYAQAAPVMQIFLIGVIGNAFAVGHVLPAVEKGRAAILISAGGLLLSVLLSVLGIRLWGLPGAALGGVVSLAVGEGAATLVVARALGVRPRQLLAWAMLTPTVLATAAATGAVLALDLPYGEPYGEPGPRLLFKIALYLLAFCPVFLCGGGRRQVMLGMGWKQ